MVLECRPAVCWMVTWVHSGKVSMYQYAFCLLVFLFKFVYF